MSTSTNQPQQSILNYRESFNKKLQKVLVFSVGKDNYLNIKDLSYVFGRNKQNDQSLKPTEQEQIYRSSMQKNISTYLAVGAISSISVNLLMQKISPNFSKTTFKRLILDLGLASVCIGTGMYLSLHAVVPDLKRVKKLYLQQKDIHFIRYIREQALIYDLNLENQIKRFLSPKQYDLWNASEGVEMLSLLQ